ncbi:anthranilate synthase component 1 [Enterobacteriaceae endosymbiont of Plateumaris consimilis]|uniref:anthranilate synthase component 1 n=1 Tax=Enterobacteriaceae endosymbiont of Plateumaris consimilis TaxID=2675794 RepID=UPI001449A5F8|nr:anthranilate synthase component 1 [Enterobacteriaceae endosymbiont of Plateumaris consimilis]QJC28514.1 anthranilate synthase component 1 [Enterobacteriaceae endosymbiont of Plateumaris consimilis]
MKIIKPILQLITTKTVYIKNPTIIFNKLCKQKKYTLLLESVDINSKKHLQSLLIIDSSLRVSSIKNTVTIQAFSENGNLLLQLLDNFLPKNISNIKKINNRFLILPEIEKLEDEDTRLKSSSVFDILRYILKLVKLPNKNENKAMFLGGLFSYDLIYNFEKLPQKIKYQNICPDYCFYLSETLLVIDHKKKISHLQASIYVPNKQEFKRLNKRIENLSKQIEQTIIEPLTNINIRKKINKNISYTCNQEDSEYCNIIKKMKFYIQSGEIFQVVPSRKFFIPCYNPLVAYDILKKINPSPYMFFMQDKEFILFGASPESSLKFNSINRQVELYPIAGTRSRKYINNIINLDLDSRIELEMRIDQKEMAEHLMLVDLARNDLAKICIPGSRYVADLTKVDRYYCVMHLVSRVIGILKPNLDALHAYRACMNMGTLTGAPKIRAMELISIFEKEQRGSYGGSMGYLTGHGDLDTCIIIRSAYIKNNKATVQAGAGIVLNSEPLSEAKESFNKAKAVLNAITKSNFYYKE